MALLIFALLQRIFLMSSLMLLLVWLIFFMVLIKLLPILGTISGKTVNLMVFGLNCLGNNRQDWHPPNCMFSCLQIFEGFLWFVLITLLNVTLIILTLSVSRLLNLLFFFFNDTATTEIYTLSLHDALPISLLSLSGREATQVMAAGRLELAKRAMESRSEEHTSELQSRPHLVCRLLLEKKKTN